MFIVGVDENGLGPRLGPLVATAVTLEVSQYHKDDFSQIGRSLGIKDSKVTSGFGRMAQVEGVVLAMVENLHGTCPQDANSLFDLVSLDGLELLQAPCPEASLAQCWSSEVLLPAFKGDIDRGREVFHALRRQGIAIVSVRSAVACAGVLNSEVKRLGSKFAVDLCLFERLLIECRNSVPSHFDAYCGMVGGIRKYSSYLHSPIRNGIEIIEEERGHSVYRAPGIGWLTFEVHADANHLPVSLASMFGKYVRELAMERQNRFYYHTDPELHPVSGYHDRLTSRFIKQSQKLRDSLGLAKECFER